MATRNWRDSCNDAVKGSLLPKYLQNELDDAGVRSFEEHLTVCSTCSEDLEYFRETLGPRTLGMTEMEIGILRQTIPRQVA